MADTAAVEPVYVLVDSIKRNFTTLVGPYFDAALTPPIMPCVSFDILSRSKYSDIHKDELRGLINNALATIKPNEEAVPVRLLSMNRGPILSIRVVPGISSDCTKMIRDTLDGSPAASLYVYVVFVRAPKSGKPVKWRGSVEDTLEHYATEHRAFDGELGFDFDPSLHTYVDYAEAEAHAQDLMRRATETNGSDCVAVPYKDERDILLRLEDKVVGATYNQKSDMLWEIFCVKKIKVDGQGRRYEKIV